MKAQTIEDFEARVKELEERLAESEQIIDAIKAGEVDAIAVNYDHQPEVYTLQSGDYAYRVLIEEFGEGAVNLTEDGLIVYTNKYFLELLILPYDKLIGAVIYDFIHPNSLEKFNELFKKALAGRSNGEISLLINEKVIPVYVSLASLQPKLATVGVIITDLTKRKKNEADILKYQEDLESKNRELTQTNTELASFTYIASHDLQEPLRKIQTFTNRLLDKEFGSFSENAKGYFQRIVSASERMQNLIVALLEYSRTNTTEIVFTSTDLNSVLVDVKNNLSELLEETNAVIESSPLPTLNVIPHQFNQLFHNIISNAVKYRKQGIAPIIKISAGLQTIDGMRIGNSNPGDKCWEIKVEDNGVGFEQQYADKIFELFQRLYSRQEYEGTGIGLAICKKIVQNHRGVIKATSELGAGSTFNIYLPLTS